MDSILTEALSNIKIIVSDVDGILTDGTLFISSDSEFKRFHVDDGVAVSLARLAGIPLSFISARKSDATTTRLKELGIKHYFVGYLNKVEALDEVLKIFELSYDDVLYIGDGLVDIPVLERAGCKVTVPNAMKKVKEVANWITTTRGGEGVLLEVVSELLKAKEIYDDTLDDMRRKIYKD